MLVVATITDRPDDQDAAWAYLPKRPAGPLLVINEHALRSRVWHSLDGAQRPLLDPASIRVPLWACFVDRSTAKATFFATTQWHPAATTLAAFHSTDDAPPPAPNLASWAYRVVAERAQVNRPIPRPGRRPLPGPEIEAKITIIGQVNPLAVARTLRDRLATIAPGAVGCSLYRRILRSEIYRPAGPGLRQYAALTPRADGTWWAKTKILRNDGLHKTIRPATDHAHALALITEAFEPQTLRRVGQLHRSTWDLLSPPDPYGHWCTVTVDTTTLAPYPGLLQQVEIEYGGCLATTSATTDPLQLRRAVGATADAAVAALSAVHIPHAQSGQSKIEYFLTEGQADACD
ncbi:hypothetical protein AB0M46_34840 [Dactylosporangium sp. NPDC051485]|uniref:hypothetical protein n=1 Tax=Dactylosporangium sp. NPDC051485 TaxID=3154846 RepID=UPI003414705D